MVAALPLYQLKLAPSGNDPDASGVALEIQRPKFLRSGEVVALHASNVATEQPGASADSLAVRLRSARRKLARAERLEILREVMTECGLSLADVGAAIDATPKHIAEILAGRLPFEAELLLPQAARAMFLRLMQERHEQRRKAGR